MIHFYIYIMSEDQGWKPSGRIRPQSFVFPSPRPSTHIALTVQIRTMAQAFSTALDSAFSLDSDVTELSQSVDNKYAQTQSRPLPKGSVFLTRNPPAGDSK